MKLTLLQHTWSDVREQVGLVNPAFAKIIDDLAPDARYPLFTVKLPFGTQLFEEGKLHSALQYDILVPMGVVLSKTLEAYFPTAKNPLPYRLLRAGHLFGFAQLVNEYFKGNYESTFCWSVSSGNHSLFLLPKISNATQLSKLYRYYPQMDRVSPTGYKDHIQLFRSILREDKDPWHSEVLFFSRAWFQHLHTPQWNNFYLYVMGDIFKKQSFERGSMRWQNTFSRLYEEKFSNYSEYIIHTVKHLFAIATGVIPGFVPAINDEGAPIRSLQRIFNEGYQLEYQPIFMSSSERSPETSAVYYSLQYPTAIDLSPRLVRESNARMLDQIYNVANRCLEIFRNPHYALTFPTLHNFANKGSFHYYHHLAKDGGVIRSVQDLFNEDSRFAASTPYHALDLPVNANFMKGCIKILEP